MTAKYNINGDDEDDQKESDYVIQVTFEKLVEDTTEDEAKEYAEEVGEAIEELTPFDIEFTGDVEVDD
jgi:hypothetical protein